jgi:hypothetical protein
MSGYNHGADCSNGSCPEQMVTAPTQTQVQNIYKKQLVQVIHPIEIVKKYHCCPVYQHSYVYTVRDEIDSPQDLAYNPGGYGFPGPATLSSYRKKNLKKKSAAGRKAAVSRKAPSSRKSNVSRKATVSNARAKVKSRMSSKLANKRMNKR